MAKNAICNYRNVAETYTLQKNERKGYQKEPSELLNKEREAKTAWERNKARRLKAEFQRAAKKDKDILEAKFHEIGGGLLKRLH